MIRGGNSRRAISAVFSVLLLVIITFIAGVFLYNFVIGMLSNFVDSGSAEPFSLNIESVNVNDTCMIVYVGNRSKQEVFIVKAYINDVPHEILNATDKGTLIPHSSTGILHLQGPYVAGCLYNIKLVCDSGYSLISVARY